jgi:hypothetical protein
MNKTQAIIGAVGVIVILFIAGFYSGMINLQVSGNYGTGLSVSTKAVYTPQTQIGDFHKGETWLSEPTDTVGGLSVNREPFAKDKYIVSWMPNEMSELITLRADFNFNSLPTGLGWGDFWGHSHTVLLGCYYVKVVYMDTSGKEITIIDTKDGVNDKNEVWDTNYVEMIKAHFPPDSRRINDQGYQFPNGKYDKVTGGGWFFGLIENIGFDSNVKDMTFYNPDYLRGGTWDRSNWWAPEKCKATVQTDTMEFYMKGLRTGALKVSYGVGSTYLKSDNYIHATFKFRNVDNVVTDACYLASGAGDVQILSTGHIPESPLQEQEQKEMKDSTGKTTWGNWYTKYVFEEKQQIQIGVKTGYSGTSLSQGDAGYGEPWTLAIYNGKGVQVWTIPVADNFNGQKSYTIPTGAFIPGGNNEWKVVLKNTLFDEAEVVLFVVDSLKKVPGPVKVLLDKDRYIEGDTVTLSVSAMANPLSVGGTGQITSFWVDVKYGSTSSTYRVSGFPKLLPAQKKSATNLTYVATYSFPLENLRPVSLDRLYVRAHAIDKDGRAGVEGEVVGIYVEQKVPVNEPGYSELMGGDTLTFIIVIIIIIVLIGVGIFLFQRYYKKPKATKWKGGKRR